MMGFCLGRPGSNPGDRLGIFLFRISVTLFSMGVELFLITCNRTVHILHSSFLFSSFTVVKFIHSVLAIYQENVKEAGKSPYLKRN